MVSRGSGDFGIVGFLIGVIIFHGESLDGDVNGSGDFGDWKDWGDSGHGSKVCVLQSTRGLTHSRKGIPRIKA